MPTQNGVPEQNPKEKKFLRVKLIAVFLLFVTIGFGTYFILNGYKIGGFKPERFSEQFSYFKELQLYQSLDSNKRQEYLNLNRAEKIAQYKRQLS